MRFGAIEGDIGGERGLAHAGTPGKDDEIGPVEPCGLVVDDFETGGLARQASARIHRRFGHLERRDRGAAEIFRLRAARRAFGHLEQAGFRLGDLVHRGDFVRRVERIFDQSAAHADQFAQKSEIVDLARQFARGEQALPVGGQLSEIGDAAERLQRLVLLEIGLERYRRGDRIALDQLQQASASRLEGRVRARSGLSGASGFESEGRSRRSVSGIPSSCGMWRRGERVGRGLARNRLWVGVERSQNGIGLHQPLVPDPLRLRWRHEHHGRLNALHPSGLPHRPDRTGRRYDHLAQCRYRAGAARRHFRSDRGKQLQAAARGGTRGDGPVRSDPRRAGRAAGAHHRAGRRRHGGTAGVTISRSATAIIRRFARPRLRRSRRSTWRGAASTTGRPSC